MMASFNWIKSKGQVSVKDRGWGGPADNPNTIDRTKAIHQ